MSAATMFVAMAALSAVVSARGVDLTPVVDQYLKVQQALAADRLEGVTDSAATIAAQAAKLGDAGGAIAAAAGELQQASDLKAARAAFGRLGDAIIVYARDTDAKLGDDVKVAYCPMARKYWLQQGDEIANPFYGKSMSDCGRINPGLPDLKK